MVRKADGAFACGRRAHGGGGARRAAGSPSSATTTSRVPAIRYIGNLIDEGAIGPVTHFRIEMDEDYMADAEAPFSWRSEKSAGYGALDDFAVHPMSLVSTLFELPEEVFGEMRKPYADRPDGRRRRAVENYDIAAALLRIRGGVSATIQVSRCAWGRKGRLQIADFRRAGRARLRPGAVQRGRRLPSPTAAPRTRASPRC